MTALSRHWEQFPPVHVSLAALVRGLGGSSSGASSAAPQAPTADLGELIAAFPHVPRSQHGGQ